MKTRPTKDEYFIAMAKLVATRSTCARRSVGCVLVNSRGHVLATGYNGRAAGLPHCNEVTSSEEPVQFGTIKNFGMPNRCAGASAESGQALDQCEAIHAEQNALLQCRDVYSIEVCYCTTAPCIHCVKLLLNTSCKRIVFEEDYPGDAARLWKEAGRSWERLSAAAD